MKEPVALPGQPAPFTVLLLKSGSCEIRGEVLRDFCIPSLSIFDSVLNLETLRSIMASSP